MAKKSVAAKKVQSIKRAKAPVAKPVNTAHICYERIIPEDIDKKFKSGPFDSGTKMALIKSKLWTPGQILRCRFLHGDLAVQKKVEKVAHLWEKYANIKFKFVKTGPAEVRIAFANDGSWSAVGRDALNTAYFPLHQPTMNYGWLDASTPDDEYQRVVLHEFGHALGCIHEHQSPKFDRKWDAAKVVKYFSGSPNFWNAESINHNVLQKYSPQGVNATEFDPDSIMLYMFDRELFSDGLGATNDNRTLSKKDIAFIKRIYP